MKKNAIILINWNGSSDTVNCVKSIQNLKHVLYDVIIIDNSSTDNSIELIKRYFTNHNILYSFTEVSEANNTHETENFMRINLVKSNKNLGFAGGNNLGIKLALTYQSYDYIWLLNNDTEIDPDSLYNLNKDIITNNSSLIGSIIIDFIKRDEIQCIGGGSFFPFLGITKLCGKGLNINLVDQNKPVKLDYLMGASILFEPKILDTIGFIDEKYFMYFEESDWQMKAKKAGFKISVSYDSFVYHKGSVSTVGNKRMFYYYYNRSSIIFTRKFYNISILISASIFLSLITLIKTKFNLSLFSSGIRGIFDGYRISNFEKN